MLKFDATRVAKIDEKGTVTLINIYNKQKEEYYNYIDVKKCYYEREREIIIGGYKNTYLFNGITFKKIEKYIPNIEVEMSYNRILCMSIKFNKGKVIIRKYSNKMEILYRNVEKQFNVEFFDIYEREDGFLITSRNILLILNDDLIETSRIEGDYYKCILMDNNIIYDSKNDAILQIKN